MGARRRPTFARCRQASRPHLPLPSDEIPELVSRDEAAVLRRCSIRQVDRLREAGEIATQPSGRRTFVLRASIAAYLARERAALEQAGTEAMPGPVPDPGARGAARAAGGRREGSGVRVEPPTPERLAAIS
jgi:hypothetical protein